MPKTSFDGKGSWQSFKTKFNVFAENQCWTSKERLNYLCLCFEGQASDFFARTMAREPDIDYFELLKKIERRFNIEDLPETAQMYFSYATQSAKENIVEWADRVVSMATKAYSDLTDAQIYRQAIFRFCQGLTDKAAGHYTINLRPRTMEEAIDKVRWYQHTDWMMYGRNKRDVKAMKTGDSYDTCSVEFGREETADNEQCAQISRAFIPKKSGQEPKPGNSTTNEKKVRFEPTDKYEELEKRVGTVEKAVTEIGTTVNKGIADLTKQIEGLTGKFQKRKPIYDKKDIRCYTCGELGHYSNECDKKRSRARISAISEGGRGK